MAAKRIMELWYVKQKTKHDKDWGERSCDTVIPSRLYTIIICFVAKKAREFEQMAEEVIRQAVLAERTKAAPTAAAAAATPALEATAPVATPQPPQPPRDEEKTD